MIRTFLSNARAISMLAAVIAGFAGSVDADERYVTVASTTSTQNSGLFDHILPIFTKKTGVDVRVVAVGTGAAMRLARSGDADVLLVHHKASEEKFVADGYGRKRHPLMYNDFVLVGPKPDPAGIRGGRNAAAALAAIANAKAVFASRGDDSGTHKRERELWKNAGIDAAASSGTWYRETGSGMGMTLNVASGTDAYALTDRGTWLSFSNRGNLGILVSGDPLLRNEYGVIVVSREKFAHIKEDLGQGFIDWLTSREGQDAINSYRVNGEQLFYGLAERPLN